jgi:hypothetical protein
MTLRVRDSVIFAESRNVIAPVPTRCHGPSSNLENRLFPPELGICEGLNPQDKTTFEVLDPKCECATNQKVFLREQISIDTPSRM